MASDRGAALGLDPSASRPFEVPGAARTVCLALAAVGVATAIAGAFLAPERLWAGWLLATSYTLGLALAGLCFVAIHYTTGSTWSVAFRRVPEALSGTLPLPLAMMALLLIVHPQLYPWTTDAQLVEGAEKALAFKRLWLSWPFFIGRAVAYAAIWLFFAWAIGTRSRRQDRDGHARWTRENFRLSAACLICFGITVTFSSFDWLMSLEHHWFSTIFGVYNFAGLFQSGLAAIILIALWLERQGALKGVLNEGHLHDLGKLLFAFSVFWAYIWFSQYMLIWYTNMPEETGYFVRRVSHGWFPLFLLNVIVNWAVPFLVLIRRDTKRQRQVIGSVAALVLLGRWLDMFLMIHPSLFESPAISVWDVGLTLGAAGAFGFVLMLVLSGAPAVPVHDPALGESLQYEH